MEQPDRPLGREVDWSPAQPPARAPLTGAHVTLRPLDAAADAEALYAESHPPSGDAAIWDYLPYGPHAGPEALRDWLRDAAASQDPLFFTAVKDGRAAGIASYLHIEPGHGRIEIGHIWFGVTLRRTTAATEAIYLMARHAFDTLGYRRLEWACNALNEPSRRAAARFGFTFEGVFRQHQVVKGRNRDTAWHSITDGEWPAIRAAFEAWLAPDNFTADGRQRRALAIPQTAEIENEKYLDRGN
jgi:RimJ/RimL family protein N-acetyltransferase